ncbi:hypothetical protein FB45DRAFT_1011834 [Roridomyces roridus]|uniref:Uncharacterized protein n=1 Tax=Roridomyces roridus TaxID=1738132 RepID=A0AAD7B190_9AGAR|nr:hypothetical protein FB45DRAFT_1011834 [Roridomyces roridus]
MDYYPVTVGAFPSGLRLRSRPTPTSGGSLVGKRRGHPDERGIQESECRDIERKRGQTFEKTPAFVGQNEGQPSPEAVAPCYNLPGAMNGARGINDEVDAVRRKMWVGAQPWAKEYTRQGGQRVGLQSGHTAWIDGRCGTMGSYMTPQEDPLSLLQKAPTGVGRKDGPVCRRGGRVVTGPGERVTDEIFALPKLAEACRRIKFPFRDVPAVGYEWVHSYGKSHVKVPSESIEMHTPLDRVGDCEMGHCPGNPRIIPKLYPLRPTTARHGDTNGEVIFASPARRLNVGGCAGAGPIQSAEVCAEDAAP